MENDKDLFEKTIGTPKEYSDGIYLVYVELYETNDSFRAIISKHATITTELEFGYICEVNIQGIPEIARSLALENHAVYQIVRLAKLTKS
jgi:hypothetical protein